MKINAGSPSAKVRHATVSKLSVILPQQLRLGVSLVENLLDLGDWAAVSDLANSHVPVALGVCAIITGVTVLAVEELSILADLWACFLAVKSVWYFQQSIYLASVWGLDQIYLQTHSQRRRRWSKNSRKQRKAFASPPPRPPSRTHTFLK